MKKMLLALLLLCYSAVLFSAPTVEMATQTARQTWWYFNSVLNQPSKTQYGFSVKLKNGNWLTDVKSVVEEKYQGLILTDSGLTNQMVVFLDSTDIVDWAFVDKKYLVGGFSFRLDYPPTPERKMLCSFLGAIFIFAEAVNDDFLKKSRWDLELLGYEENEKFQIEMGRDKKDLFSNRFKGGVDGFYRFLSENIVYPPFAQKIGLEGYCYIQFDVYPSGHLGDIVVLQSIGGGSKEMCEATIRKLPLLKPRKTAGLETIVLPIKLVLR